MCNTTGYSNVAIGTSALYGNSDGHNLVAVGDSALFNQATSVSYNNTSTPSCAAIFTSLPHSGMYTRNNCVSGQVAHPDA